MKPVLTCGNCGVSGVRLYRPYASIYRPKDNRCNACVSSGKQWYYVPLVVDIDGLPWGYTPAPHSGMMDFFSKPESSLEHKCWDFRSSMWDDPPSYTVCQEVIKNSLLWWKGIGSGEKADLRYRGYDLRAGRHGWLLVSKVYNGYQQTWMLYEDDLILNRWQAFKFWFQRWPTWATALMLLPLLLVLV